MNSSKLPDVLEDGGVAVDPGNAEEMTYIHPKSAHTHRRAEQRAPVSATFENVELEPLIDLTEALPKRSKKTGRLQKRLVAKQQKEANRVKGASLLDLPPELLEQVLGFLRPSDVYRAGQVNQTLRELVVENGNAIARDIIKRRYWVLSRCFPLPRPFGVLDSSAHPALLSERRLDLMEKVHKRPYQHVKGWDSLKMCTCSSCVFAWNNLCMILDLHHWQRNLDKREPIPMIQRGTSPEWNQHLLDSNAVVVERALNGDTLVYAAILEKHLQTTMSTLSRTFRGKKTIHPKRVYHFSSADAQTETDEFLERSGPHSYEFPWHRDNYYSLEAYIPNRKWSKELERWMYYAYDLHEKDLSVVKERFTSGGPTAEEIRQKLRKHDHNAGSDTKVQPVLSGDKVPGSLPQDHSLTSRVP